MESIDIKKTDKEKIVNTYARYDLAVKQGKGAVCTSYDGKEYIDFTSGIGVNSLGFCDDGWVKAVTEQLNKLQHISNLFYTEPQVKAAELLTAKTGMSKVFFGNSGAEANEAAIKTARKYGSKVKGNSLNKIVTLVNSFHGRTMATITATGQDHYHQYFTPFVEGFAYCEPDNIQQLEELVDDNACAVMLEMIQGEGGVIALSEEFVKAAEKLCRQKDILLIIDEVQTGVGRTGRMFCYEHYGIKPDMVTFAKGIGGGLPVGGVIFGEKCCDVLEPGDHGTTYGGNPVVCAGVVEVLSRVDSEFLEAVTAKGEYIRAALADIPQIEEITGKGLMMGLKLKDKKASDAVSQAMSEGLLLLTAKDRVRLLPPLTITYEEIDRGLEILKKIL